MAQRAELQGLLEAIIAPHPVYFQPPEKMSYPCIRYKLDDVETEYADNRPYTYEKRYQVTVIDHDPDSPIFDEVVALSKCRFDRFYIADGLNHFVFTLFY